MTIKRVAFVAGEASGDLLGAGLIREFKKYDANIQYVGIAGPKMIRAGCESWTDIDNLAVMGFIEPLLRLPRLINIRRAVCQRLLQDPPDVFIGIDAPDFNLGLEKILKSAGIPVVHYVSPSVWAWRQKRVHKIARAVDLMLTLLPFEADFYRKHGVRVAYVGHPMADEIPQHVDKLTARTAFAISENEPLIALLPGSRKSEVARLGEVFVRAAGKMPNVKFIAPMANQERYHEFTAIHKKIAPKLPITIVVGKSRETIAAADLVMLSSGTATLETMLLKKPMVIAYKLSFLTYQIARLLVKTPFIGLPNILAGKELVPEFIQSEATADNIATAALDLLANPMQIELLEHEFSSLHDKLRCNASNTAFKAIMELLTS